MPIFVKWFLTESYLTNIIINGSKHVQTYRKVVIKILHASAVIQTDLGRLTIYRKVANFLQCICVKIIPKNWLAVDTVIAKISSKAHFLAYPVDRPSLSTSGWYFTNDVYGQEPPTC